MDPSDQEFDDWFNDATAAEEGDEIGNQAAKFDDRVEEVRTKCEDPNSLPATRCSGQLYTRFDSVDGETKIFKASSGTLIKKIADDNYVFLTAAHNLSLVQDGSDCEFDSGYFFLQKKGKEEGK